MPEPGLEVLGKRPGSWKVLLSSKALKSFLRFSRSGSFGPIEEKLRDLAFGIWSRETVGDKQQNKKLRVPLVKTECKQQIWILWQVDVASNDSAQTKTQLVKVWEVGTETEILDTVDRVILLQQLYSDDHVAQCRQRPMEDVDRIFIPTLFKFADGQNAASLESKKPELDVRTVDREVLELANRFYTLTESMIGSVFANDLLAEFPFDLSGDEATIILHLGTSSLILGRSGTGKTTCLVFKMLVKYAAGSNVAEERSPRQLFLTRSDELASKLKAYINRLMRTLGTNSIIHGERDDQELPLIGSEDEEDRDTIFTLKDGSFPFVGTFDCFMELLENTIDFVDQEGLPIADGDDTQEEQQSEPSDSSEVGHPQRLPLRGDKTAHLVDFQSFKLDYWPRFPANLVRNFPIEAVFAEIMGVIKGSLSCRHTLQPLSRSEYLELSRRVAPSFILEDERLRLYDVFEKYQGLKLKRQELDGVDRVGRVIKALRECPELKKHIKDTFDEIYVDEVQDLRCLDLELLLSLLDDGRAFHCAGDTAQAISDSHFRFQDIKSLFHDHFAATALVTNQPKLAQAQLFMLMKNYRSHQGILGLASLVMEMLWNHFPETVDKLEPEVGEIHGPLPIFFLGCDAQMLASCDAGSADQPTRTLDFGAEQVILVRDAAAKAKLQSELKDEALVLTILQSKGMEFEDVFLWNFFTDSPCPGGWRRIERSKVESGKFDAVKHAGMCSELKNFYVAITRARIRFSIVESEEGLAARVADLLKDNVSSPLVEVTRSSDPEFLEELISLRSISHDSQRWLDKGEELMQRKYYEDAVICFRKAKSERRESHAMACIFEERGRRAGAVDDVEAAQVCFRSAVDKFTELGMIFEAVRCLERLQDFEEAAWLWARSQKPGKAAPLFVKARMFREASNHYYQALCYDKAADVLRQGCLAEELVSYLTENRDKLTQKVLQSHSRFCILLLKKNQIGPRFVGPAIGLIGSPIEQEREFIRYDMHDRLADLYTDQRHFEKRFLLFIRIGKLEMALNSIKDLNNSEVKVLQDLIRRAEDYYFAGRAVCPKLANESVPSHLRSSSSDWLKAQQLVKNQRWDPILTQIQSLNEGVAKDFLEIHSLFNLSILEKAKTLTELPFKAIEVAIGIADGISSHTQTESVRDPLVLLLTGVMPVDHGPKPFILLPWSPLLETAANVNIDEYPKLANQWFFTKLGCIMLGFDDVLRKIWHSEWPLRCAHFLSRGFCRQVRDDSHRHLHKRVEEAEHKKKVSDLITINATFCSLTPVHRKRVLEEDFQHQFFGIRRHWLEFLLRELTFISSFEQSSRVITETRLKILSCRQNLGRDKRLSILAASMEELMFYRLGKEWNERSNLSSLFEQIHFSQFLDSTTEKRLGRHLRYKLCRCPGMQVQQQILRHLQDLEHNMGMSDASAFNQTLQQFKSQLCRADITHFSSFHSVATLFEFFTTYLTLRSCRFAVLLPQSWIDLHIARLAPEGQSLLAKEVADAEKQVYASGLVELTMCFCELLSRLNRLPDTNFRFGRSPYPSRLLHLRNTELLGLAIINLEINHSRMKGCKEARERVRQVFSLPHIRGLSVQGDTRIEFLEKLVASYKVYEGKDWLKFFTKTNDQNGMANQLRARGVQSAPFAKLISTTSTSHSSPQAPPSSEAEPEDSCRLEAIERIQKFWRCRYPKMKARRQFFQSPIGTTYSQMLEICSRSSPSKMMRCLLTGYAVDTYEHVRCMRSTTAKLQQRAGQLLESARVEKFEELDEAMQLVGDIDESLEDVVQSISMDIVEDLAGGDWTEVQRRFQHVESTLSDLGNKMGKATEMVEAIEAGSEVM